MGMREKVKIDNIAIANATMWAKARFDDTLSRAEAYKNDLDKAERHKACECIVCWKSGRIGGAAMTSAPCPLCDEVIHSGSTNVDRVCLACAKKYKLCKHCAADIDLKQRRKLWLPNRDVLANSEVIDPEAPNDRSDQDNKLQPISSET